MCPPLYYQASFFFERWPVDDWILFLCKIRDHCSRIITEVALAYGAMMAGKATLRSAAELGSASEWASTATGSEISHRTARPWFWRLLVGCGTSAGHRRRARSASIPPMTDGIGGLPYAAVSGCARLGIARSTTRALGIARGEQAMWSRGRARERKSAAACFGLEISLGCGIGRQAGRSAMLAPHLQYCPL